LGVWVKYYPLGQIDEDYGNKRIVVAYNKTSFNILGM
jgi:hypothetical protein